MTTDCWTSRVTQTYMAITAHFLDSDWTSHSFNLLTEELTESHTADNLEDCLRDSMEEWDILNKVSTVIYDNAANITNAVKALNYDGIETIESFPCAAHTLQLSLKKGLRLPECDSVVNKVSRLVSAFNHYSSKCTYALQKHLKQTEKPILKLIQSCPTRWNLILAMLERPNELRASIVAVLSDRSIFDKNTAQRIEILESEWETINTLISLLTAFQIATTVLSSDTEIIISLVRPIINSLITKHLKIKNDDTKLGKDFKFTVVADLKERFSFQDYSFLELEEVTISHIACFLDPRYKNLNFEDFDETREKVRNKVRKIFDQINDSPVLQEKRKI